jgi:hypothetical protein
VKLKGIFPIDRVVWWDSKKGSWIEVRCPTTVFTAKVTPPWLPPDHRHHWLSNQTWKCARGWTTIACSHEQLSNDKAEKPRRTWNANQNDTISAVDLERIAADKCKTPRIPLLLIWASPVHNGSLQCRFGRSQSHYIRHYAGQFQLRPH